MTVSLVNIDPRTEETMILTATRACLLLLASTSVVGAWTAPSTFPQQRTAAGTTNNDILYATNKDEWSIADDWNELSAENPLNSAPNSQDIFNQNIGQKATQSILPDNHGEQMEEWSAEDRWVHDIIDQFQNPISTSPLYDTGSSKEDDFLTKNKNFEEHMGDEIAMLVRCNESPEDMLVRAGRAVPELPEEQKMDASQLVIWRDSLGSHEEGFWEATPFLHQAVKTIFHLHAADDNQEEVTMDAKAVSRWMTQSLGDELDSYTERAGKDMTSFRQTKTIKIGPHDSRVLKVISKYGTYGTGKINLQSFQQVYLDALTHMDTGMELKGSVETLHLRNGDHIRQVWRDFKNHGIVGPNEQKWKEAHTQLEAQYGSLQEQTRKFLEKGSDIFMDECEILDYNYNPPPTPEQVAEGYDAKNHKYIRKSSHEQVALAPDNQTPLYMEEGSFVFIDEESW